VLDGGVKDRLSVRPTACRMDGVPSRQGGVSATRREELVQGEVAVQGSDTALGEDVEAVGVPAALVVAVPTRAACQWSGNCC
jgi:hypothetical protein